MAAVGVLTTVAEAMWHPGVDLCDYQNQAMKNRSMPHWRRAGFGLLLRTLRSQLRPNQGNLVRAKFNDR